MKGVALSIVLTAAVLSAQTGTSPQPQTPPTFRAAADLVSIVVTPRDASGAFVPGLSNSDLRVFEDGVEQSIVAFTYNVGGRNFSPPRTGRTASTPWIILPDAWPPPDSASRIFIIFIDDLHITPDLTPRLKTVLTQIRNTVLHDNDLIGIVSTGYSSIARDPAYDPGHRRFDAAVNKTMGAGPSLSQILAMQQSGDGLAELNHHAHVAFLTAHDLLEQLDRVTTVRKAFIWISSGYSLNPLKESRLKNIQDAYNGQDPFANQGMQFKEADLLRQIDDLTRAAARANVMFFPIDPRGLMVGPGADTREQISFADLRDYQEMTASTLKVLADETGGLAAVNMNDLGRYLQSLDRMMMDYYIIGYQSSNHDPLRFVRNVEVRATRPDIHMTAGVDYRERYTIKRR